MFTGWQLDEEDGLYYYRARYYDLRREDFCSETRRDAASMNLYLYTEDNPLNGVDPTGLVDEEKYQITIKARVFYTARRRFYAG